MSLVPCPFCASTASDAKRRQNTCEEVYFVRCCRCGARGPEATARSEAKELWKRRAIPPARPERRVPIIPKEMLS